MNYPLSEEAIEALAFSKTYASCYFTGTITANHLLRGILALPHSRAKALIVARDVNCDALNKKLEDCLKSSGSKSLKTTTLHSPKTKRALEIATREAKADGEPVGTHHLLLAIASMGGTEASNVMREFGLIKETIRSEMLPVATHV